MQRSFTTGRFRRRRDHISWSGGRLASAFTAALLLAGIALPRVEAQAAKPTEYDVKAAYLINFGKFVRVSGLQEPHPSFDICVLGRDSFGQSLDALASNEAIDHLPVRVLHPDVTGAKSCRVVFISSLEGENIREDLALLGNAGVLTVSDASDFLERGGMIQFVLIQNHVRFAVNLDAVSRGHLVLSSELLRVASYVTGKRPAGGTP